MLLSQVSAFLEERRSLLRIRRHQRESSASADEVAAPPLAALSPSRRNINEGDKGLERCRHLEEKAASLLQCAEVYGQKLRVRGRPSPVAES